jgi:hypothetical protein
VGKRDKTPNTRVRSAKAEGIGLVSFGITRKRSEKVVNATKPVVFFYTHAPNEGYPNPDPWYVSSYRLIAFVVMKRTDCVAGVRGVRH